MKKRNENDPDNLGGLGNMLPAEVLKKLNFFDEPNEQSGACSDSAMARKSLLKINKLLELLHQADNKQQGSNNTFIYVASGAQYVKNLYQQASLPDPPRRRGNNAEKESVNPPFDANTPLSALFHESHHEELRRIIDSWRPYLINDDPAIDALSMTRFEFDFDKVIATHIYIDIGRLLHDHALKDDNMSLLAKYLFQHTNLSNSQSTLYVQLRKYKKR